MARDRHDARFAPLARHAEGGLLEVHLFDSEPHGFAHPETSAVDHLYQSSVALALERPEIRGGQQPLQHLRSERFGESLGEPDATGRGQVSTRPKALLLQELEKRPKGTDPSPRC